MKVVCVFSSEEQLARSGNVALRGEHTRWKAACGKDVGKDES
jgi:hypothetical protein